MVDFNRAIMNPLDPGAVQAAMGGIRQNEAAALLAQITGDPILGRVGLGMQERASARRKGLTRAREKAQEAKSKTQQVRPSGVPGFVLRGNKVEMMPGYDEMMEKRHQRGLALAREKAKGRGQDDWYARQMWLRTMGTPAQMADARKTLSYLPELQAQAREFSTENIEIPAGWEGAAQFARENLPLGSSIAPSIERFGMAPEAVSWLERGRQSEQDIMRLASGLAVTEFELQNIKNWSPWAGNLTKEQRINRLRNIYNKLGREATAVGGHVWQDQPPDVFLGQQVQPGQIPPGGAPGQVTPGQVAPTPGMPPQIPPAAIPPAQTAPAPQITPETPGARTPPTRPEGLTDEEWQQYLRLEGFL